MLKNIITRFLNRMGYRLNRIEAPFRPAMPLKKEHIQNCRLVTNRDELLKYMPKQSICTEVGIAHGDCSAKILSIVNPSQLHLIDNNNEYIEYAKKRFLDKIGAQVFLHHGDSFSELMKFQDDFFDWIYIDANHSYDYEILFFALQEKMFNDVALRKIGA